MKFYTYIYFRANGTPYYVGKGKGKRAYSKKRSVTRPIKPRIFIQYWASEQEAFEIEKFYIRFYGRKDNGTGILRNLTDGGENPPLQTGHISTPKQIAASMRQGNINAESGLLNAIRTPESTSKGGKTVTEKKLSHLQRVGQSLRGKPRSPEVKRKCSEAVAAAHARFPGKLWRSRNRGISC